MNEDFSIDYHSWLNGNLVKQYALPVHNHLMELLDPLIQSEDKNKIIESNSQKDPFSYKQHKLSLMQQSVNINFDFDVPGILDILNLKISNSISNHHFVALKSLNTYLNSEEKVNKVHMHQINQLLDDDDSLYDKNEQSKHNDLMLFPIKYSDKSEIRATLESIFLQFNCKIPNIYRAQLFFLDFLVADYKLIDSLFYDHAQLISFQERTILAIQGAASLKNNYVMNIMGEQYVLAGGDIKKIEDFDELDPKFKSLHDVIQILSQNPLALIKQKDTLQKLIGTQNNQWTKQQLLLALIIVAFSQYLSTVASALQIRLDMDALIINPRGSKNNFSSSSIRTSLNKISQDELQADDIISKLNQLEIGLKLQNNQDLQELVGQDYIDDQLSIDNADLEEGDEALKELFFPLGEPENINKRTKLYYSDYNINDSTKFLEEVIGSVSKILHQRYNIVQQMTMNNYGTKQNINTEKLRTAIWKYSEAILGYVDDCFDFERLKKIMIDHQNHIDVVKKVVFNPSSTLNGGRFAEVDFVHLVILSSNAKFYVCVNSISKFIDSLQ